MRKYNYLFSRLLHVDRGVIYHILRGGSKSGDHPSASLKVSNYDPNHIYAPGRDLVVSSLVAERLIAGDSSLKNSFSRFSKVESYQVDPLDYPRSLDALVVRDDIESVIWRKIPRGRILDESVYEFTPRVMTYPEMVDKPDFRADEIEYSVWSRGELLRQKQRLEWSPQSIPDSVCCWVGGGYFVSDAFLARIEHLIPDELWELVRL